MYKIILVSHGDLAEAMYRTAELIAGKHEGVETFGLHLSDDVEAFRSTVESAVERAVKTDELLVLSDIQSGSPFNVAVGAMMKYKFRHVTGMNLAMVVEALGGCRNMTLEEVTEDLAALGRSGITDVNALLESSDKDEEA